MRIHIDLDPELVAKIDAVAGQRGRSRFLREAAEGALEREGRWALIEAAKGSIADTGHDWDRDSAAWVRRQRRGDRRRVG